jgi:ethanolamine utilization protein EutN
MMIKGRVIGRVWSTKRVDALPKGTLLEVEIEGGARVIAFDPLGCGQEEEVLITQGSVAAGYFEGMKVPVDALIIGSIDERS